MTREMGVVEVVIPPRFPLVRERCFLGMVRQGTIVLGAFTGLRDLGVGARVSGYLSCTDNMPSGSAHMLGDLLRIRGAGTMQVDADDAWRSQGATGLGARLLLEEARTFTPPE